MLAKYSGYKDIELDYFVGGYPVSSKVELGVYSFIYTDTEAKYNMTGRIYDAFTNITLSSDYSLYLYEGYGMYNHSTQPYEHIDTLASGDYYTGYFQLFDLPTNSYILVAESDNYVHNFL